MNNTIKPPGTPGSSPIDVPNSSESNSVDSTQNDAVDFGSLLETENIDAVATSEIDASSDTGHLASIDHALQAGEITPEEAVDQLVEHALQSARDLPTAQREALERQLRAALAEDPTLLALQKDLNRGVET